MRRDRMLRKTAKASLAVVALVAGLAIAQQPEAGPTPKPLRATLAPPIFRDSERLTIDLPTAMRLANSSNPTVTIARVRVAQARERQTQAEVAWLPSLTAGVSYIRHDGITQNQAGAVFSSNRWSLGVGGGAYIRMDSSEALFLPLVARRLVDAQAAQASAVANDIGLEAANAYLDLLDAYGRLAINAETLENAQEMARNARAAEKAGVGATPADAPRAETEVRYRLVERQRLEARLAEVSARLVQLLLLEPTVELVPADANVVPISLVPLTGPLQDLIALGLRSRPELAESRALSAAAAARLRQAQVEPLLPKVELAYYGNYFGGGVRDETTLFGGRGDGTASVYWELRNLGAGNLAKVRERRLIVDEAGYHNLEVQARVAAEISTAAKAATSLLRSLDDARDGVANAQEAWRRLKAASFGLGGPNKRFDPLSPLIAVQQLDAARVRYLEEIIGYNKAQFRLFQAMGNPPLEAALDTPGR